MPMLLPDKGSVVETPAAPRRGCPRGLDAAAGRTRCATAVGVARARQHELHRGRALGHEAGVDALQLRSGCGRAGRRPRGARARAPPRPRPAPAACGAPRRRSRRALRPSATRRRSSATLQRRHQAEQQRRRDRRAEREEREPCRRARLAWSRGIWTGLMPRPAPARPTSPANRPAPPPASASSAALGEQLPHDAAARSAPSAVRMAISRRRGRAAGQQQVGDVGARDQQHHADRAEQRPAAPSR